MAEIGQYLLSNRELTEVILRAEGIHEGRWMLMIQFGYSAGNFGPEDGEILPGTLVAVSKVGVQRAPKEAPAALVVDASVVNPKATATKVKGPPAPKRKG